MKGSSLSRTRVAWAHALGHCDGPWGNCDACEVTDGQGASMAQRCWTKGRVTSRWDGTRFYHAPEHGSNLKPMNCWLDCFWNFPLSIFGHSWPWATETVESETTSTRRLPHRQAGLSTRTQGTAAASLSSDARVTHWGYRSSSYRRAHLWSSTSREK